MVETPLDAAVNILLPVDLAKVGLGLREKERINAAVQVSKPRRRSVAGDHDDGAHRPVLGDKPGRLAGGRKHKDGRGVKVERGADSSHGARLNDRHGPLDERAQLLKVADVWDRVLSLEAGFAHFTDSLVGVAALGGLTRKLSRTLAPLDNRDIRLSYHDTVRTISDGVANVADLSPCRPWVFDHRLEHLRRADDGLASNVAHGNDLLLSSKHLGSGNLDAKIATGNHHTVGFSKNFGEVVQTLAVLDLGDNLDVAPLLTKDLANVLDVLASPDKSCVIMSAKLSFPSFITPGCLKCSENRLTSKDHIDIVLYTKPEVVLVLL